MKVYRFAIHPEEDGYMFLECINDPALFTQARSMDEALYMARDVIQAMYETKGSLVELVVPPDVTTKYEVRQRKLHSQRVRKGNSRRRSTAKGKTNRAKAA